MASPREFFSLQRPDQRPEVYAVPPAPIGTGYRCILCTHEKGTSPLYNYKEAFMCNPVDSADTLSHFVCHHHLPENVVIFDPATNKCRDKAGQNVWTEQAHGEEALLTEMFGEDAILPPAIQRELEKK